MSSWKICVRWDGISSVLTGDWRGWCYGRIVIFSNSEWRHQADQQQQWRQSLIHRRLSETTSTQTRHIVSLSSDSRRRDWPAIYRSRRSVVRPARLDDVTDWYRGKCAGWWSRHTDCRVMTVDTDWRRSDISHVESLSADRVGRVRHSLPTTQFVSTQTDFQLYNYAAIAHVQRTPSVYLVHNTRDILHYNFAPNINIARRVL